MDELLRDILAELREMNGKPRQAPLARVTHGDGFGYVYREEDYNPDTGAYEKHHHLVADSETLGA